MIFIVIQPFSGFGNMYQRQRPVLFQAVEPPAPVPLAKPDADGWHNKATAISNSNDNDVKQPWIYRRTCCRSISLPPNVSAAVSMVSMAGFISPTFSRNWCHIAVLTPLTFLLSNSINTLSWAGRELK